MKKQTNNKLTTFKNSYPVLFVRSIIIMIKQMTTAVTIGIPNPNPNPNPSPYLRDEDPWQSISAIKTIYFYLIT